MNEEDVIRNKVGSIRHVKSEENLGKLRKELDEMGIADKKGPQL